MRIGIEAQRLFRPKKYGMDVVALELIRHLQVIDKENDYYILVRPDSDRECLEASANFHIIEIPAYNYPHWEQIQLPKYVRRLNLDVLHCTANTAPISVEIPIILTLHDVIFMEKKAPITNATNYQRVGNMYRKWLLPWIISKCQRIVTVSYDERNRILSTLPVEPKRVEVVYNGVSEQFMTPVSELSKSLAQQQYRLPEKYVLFLGNTDPKKNVANVIHAFTIFANQVPDVSMVIADVTPDTVRRHLDNLHQAALIDRFVFTGYIPRTLIPAVYAQAEVFLYPSLRESFGLPILEAMACGVPVITSNVAALPEVGGDAAILVNPTSPQAIAHALLELYHSEPLRQAKIEAGFRRFPHFSWKNSAEQMLDIYRSVYGKSVETVTD